MVAPQDDTGAMATRPAESADAGQATGIRSTSATDHPATTDKPQTPPVEYIAELFILKYFEVFCKRPEHLYRFYKDDSVYSHSCGPDENATKYNVTGFDSIMETITAHGLQTYVSKIASIDSQSAPDGSVMISVTGSLIAQHGATDPRRFSQAFLLCPQENGYFVRNDIFRFLDAAPASSGPVQLPTQSQSDDVQVAGVIKQPEAISKPTTVPASVENGPAPINHVDETTISVVSEPAGLEITDQGNGPTGNTSKNSEPVVDDVTDTASSVSPSVEKPREETDVAGSDANSQDPSSVAPKSWASLFNGRAPDGKILTEMPGETTKESPEMQSTEPLSSVDNIQDPTPAPKLSNGPTSIPNDQRSNDQTLLTVPPSVWVSQLPTNVQLADLESMMKEEFSKYGTVKNVDCRVQRGFAFVDMDSWESVGVAVEAWATQPAPHSGPFKGVKLNVQIRKQPPLKGPGRGGISRTHSGSGRGGGTAGARGGRGGGPAPEDRRNVSTGRSGRIARAANGNGHTRGDGSQQHRGGKGRSQMAE